ncbi:uncharacterized protein TNCV_1182061 [Trichonephila clavipes]|nr:uncharacterized protein TNCV_1182061 [Trichonephila clavipes]
MALSGSLPQINLGVQAFQGIQTKQVPIMTPTMCLNEEIVQQVSHAQIAFERCYLDCGLSYCIITARDGRDPVTLSRMWNRYVQDDNAERRAGSQWLPITISREDRHVIRIVLMDCVATSCALSQELGFFARRVSARTVSEVCSSMGSKLKNHDGGYL